MNKNLPFFRRLSFALQGLRSTWSGESSFRTHLVVAVLTVLVAFAVRPAPVWWGLLGLVVGVVISAELFNTAIERMADYVQPHIDEDIRAIKDIAAAAVLVASLAALAVAAAFVADVFLPGK